MIISIIIHAFLRDGRSVLDNGRTRLFLRKWRFSAPAKWQVVDYVEGIKVLVPKNPKDSKNLPERSSTPGTAYIKLHEDGSLSQIRVFGEDRLPLYDIDYGAHQGKIYLHVHHFNNGARAEGNDVVKLKPGDPLYEKYKYIFGRTLQWEI